MGWGGGSKLTTGLITFLSPTNHGVGEEGSKLATGLITFLSPIHHGWGGRSKLTTGLITFLSPIHHGVGRGVQACHRSDHLSQSDPSWGGEGGPSLPQV